MTSSKDALTPFLQAAHIAVAQWPAARAQARGALADLMAGVAKHTNEAIQVWQDFDDTEPLHAQGADNRIEHWIGAVRTQRLQSAASRVEIAVAAVATAIATKAPAFDAAGIHTAQAGLAAGASPQDAARDAIRLLSTRLVRARALVQTIEAASTSV